MKTLNKIFSLLLILLLCSSNLLAQAKTEINKNDLMYRQGRINVVVVVLAVILSGLFFYVWKLDKKITKLENND